MAARTLESKTKPSTSEESAPSPVPALNAPAPTHLEHRHQRGDHLCFWILLACALLVFGMNAVDWIIGMFGK